jgi:hypothetical protein
MILIPKYKEICNKEPIVSAKSHVGGEFRLKLRGPDGRTVKDTGWFPNLITTFGLEEMGQVNWAEYMHVGSGNTAPDVSDTALQTWMAVGANTGPADVNANSGSPNYIISTIRARRWIAGVATGTIREVGVSSANTNTDMVVRALVSPVIVKAADQALDVYYKFSIWPSLIDVTGSIGGLGSYTLRAKEVDDTFAPRAFNPLAPDSSPNAHVAWSGAIGSVTGSPTGSNDSSTSGLSPVIYDQGAGYTDYYVYWDLADGNFGGINSVSSQNLTLSTAGGCQIGFGSTIAKDATKIFQLNLRQAWAVRP